MPLPSSGEIRVSQINTELGRTSNTANSNFAGGTTPQTGSLFKLGEAGCVNQAASHKMSEWYGYPFCSPDLGFIQGSVYLGRTAPANYNDYRWGYVNASLNLNSSSYTAGGVSSHGSLSNTSPSQLDGNTITAVGVRYRSESTSFRLKFDNDGDGYIDNYFQEVYLYVKGTSTPISTWSNLTFTGEASSSGSGYIFYIDPAEPDELALMISADEFSPNVGAIVTGPGVPANTKIIGVAQLDSSGDPRRWVIWLDKNVTQTLNATYNYAGIPTQTNTYSRASATLTTGTFAYGGGSNTDGFLLYKWTSNLGYVDDGGISLAKSFQQGTTDSTEITIL